MPAADLTKMFLLDQQLWPARFGGETAFCLEIHAVGLPAALSREKVGDRFAALLTAHNESASFLPVIFSSDVQNKKVNLTIAFDRLVSVKLIEMLEKTINAEMHDHGLVADYKLIPGVDGIYEQARAAMQNTPKNPGPSGLA